MDQSYGPFKTIEPDICCDKWPRDGGIVALPFTKLLNRNGQNFGLRPEFPRCSISPGKVVKVHFESRMGRILASHTHQILSPFPVWTWPLPLGGITPANTLHDLQGVLWVIRWPTKGIFTSQLLLNCCPHHSKQLGPTNTHTIIACSNALLMKQRLPVAWRLETHIATWNTEQFKICSCWYFL